MEASLVTSTRVGLLGGRSPLLRLQSDERLIGLIRQGNAAAFEVLFGRYRTRLLAFCRHMLGSREDAEDILQDVFAAAYNAILADERAIYARPWLYRIARNRCLNHLRRPVADGRDTMDDQLGQGGASTADVVHKRADLQHLLADVQKLPETQRTALLLREIDALSYEQIAVAMETTVPSVKSLLVRARVSLAEASEARLLTCEEVREQLAEVAEGLRRTTPPLKRHLRECEQCAIFRKQLRKTSAAMAAVFPVGPFLVLKKLALAKVGAAAFAGGAGGGGGVAATGGVAGATGGMAVGAAGGATAGGLAAGGAGAAVGAVTTKAIAGIAVTAILAGGAVEAKKAVRHDPISRAPVQAVAPVTPPAQTGGTALPAESTPPLVKPPAHTETTATVDTSASAASDKAATGASGANGATGASGADGKDSGGAAGGASGASGATGAHAGTTSPATGSTSPSSGVDTGGATAPPPGSKPAPAPVSGSTAPEQPATGATGPQPDAH